MKEWLSFYYYTTLLLLKLLQVHSTAFSLSQLPASKTILETFKKAFNQDKIISVDWNYAPSIWKNINYANEVFSTIQHYKPLLKFSIDDVSRHLNKKVDIREAKFFF